MERSSLDRYGKPLPGGSEVEDSTVEVCYDPYSEGEKEDKYQQDWRSVV